jgi:hypothetical protein
MSLVCGDIRIYFENSSNALMFEMKDGRNINGNHIFLNEKGADALYRWLGARQSRFHQSIIIDIRRKLEKLQMKMKNFLFSLFLSALSPIN